MPNSIKFTEFTEFTEFPDFSLPDDVHISKGKHMKLDANLYKRIMISHNGDTNQYKEWDLTRNDVVVSRDVIFIEEKSIDQTPSVYIEKPKIMHD